MIIFATTILTMMTMMYSAVDDNGLSVCATLLFAVTCQTSRAHGHCLYYKTPVDFSTSIANATAGKSHFLVEASCSTASLNPAYHAILYHAVLYHSMPCYTIPYICFALFSFCPVVASCKVPNAIKETEQ